MRSAPRWSAGDSGAARRMPAVAVPAAAEAHGGEKQRQQRPRRGRGRRGRRALRLARSGLPAADVRALHPGDGAAGGVVEGGQRDGGEPPALQVLLDAADLAFRCVGGRAPRSSASGCVSTRPRVFGAWGEPPEAEAQAPTDEAASQRVAVSTRKTSSTRSPLHSAEEPLGGRDEPAGARGEEAALMAPAETPVRIGVGGGPEGGARSAARPPGGGAGAPPGAPGGPPLLPFSAALRRLVHHAV